MVGIGDGRLNADVAGVGRDLGLDRGDLSLKAAAGIGVDQNAHDLPDLEVSAVLFRYREVGVQLRQIRQRHDLGARGQELADLDTTHAKLAVKGRAHQLLRNDRLGFGDAGIGLLIRRLRLVHGCLRAELTRGELLGAIQRQLCHRGLRLVARKIALLGAVEQLHQRGAGLHAGAGGKHDVGDATADIGGDIHLMHGGEVADRGQKIRNDLGLGLGNGNRRRRRLVVGEELRDHLGAERVKTDESAHQHRKQQPDDDEPAHHPHRTRMRFVGNRPARNIGFPHNVHLMHLLWLPAAPDPATTRDPDGRQLRFR